MRGLTEAQDSHAERLRRLELRRGGIANVHTPGFTGCFAQATGGHVYAEVNETHSVLEGDLQFNLIHAGPDRPIDERFFLSIELGFPFPAHLSVTLRSPTETLVDVWLAGLAPADTDTGGSFLGSNAWTPDECLLGVNTDNALYVDSYPRAGRLEATDFPALLGETRLGTWKLRIIPDGATGGYTPVPEWTLYRWGLRFGDDIGGRFTPGITEGPVFWDDLTRASAGFTLSADRRSVVVPAGVGGWYRIVAGAEVAEVDPARASTRDYRACRVSARVTTDSGVVSSYIPGTYDTVSERLLAGQASGWLHVPNEGGEVSLTVSPLGDVGDDGSITGAVTNEHVHRAHLGFWKVFDDE